VSQVSFLNLVIKTNRTGVSVLDSRSLKNVDPGEDGKPWFNLMKHLHLRPIEHKKLINRRFVKGCPDHFGFGESVFVKLGDAGRIIDRVFSDPSRIHEACNFDSEISDVTPSIMLIGHDLKNDTEYLKKINFTPKHVAGKIDTQHLARISKKSPPGLSKLLKALLIDAKHLHNAGNDAAYTLQALIGVAVQEFREPGNIVKRLIAEKEILDAAKAAKRANPRKRPNPTHSAGPKTQQTSNNSSELDTLTGHAAMDGNPTSQPEETRRERKIRVRHIGQEKEE
jgi:hypothetical protein